MITGHDVLRVLDAMHLADVSPCLEGGWGIDALLGRQTRAHLDLDLCVRQSERENTLDALAVLGFEQITMDNLDNVRVAEASGRSTASRHVDLRLLDGEPTGDEHLDGRGFVVGRPVRCLSAEGQILAHTGYEPGENDVADLHRLSDLAGAQLAAPFGRGERVEYRPAELRDRGAMAVVHHAYIDAEALDPLSQASPSFFYRYWSKRLASGQSSSVAVRGGAVVGTLAVAPAHNEGPKATMALLHGFSAHPEVWNTRLLDPLVHQTVAVANGMGYRDVRIWVPDHHVFGQRFWRTLGWFPDGTRDTLGDGPTVERFRR